MTPGKRLLAPRIASLHQAGLAWYAAGRERTPLSRCVRAFGERVLATVGEAVSMDAKDRRWYRKVGRDAAREEARLAAILAASPDPALRMYGQGVLANNAPPCEGN